jgi:hypothetical protein
MIFEADAEQITRLSSQKLVQLMKRLLLAECQLINIPLRAAIVPLQVTVSDGGEDGRVEWKGGADVTDYFPSRFCVFQSKAQNLTPAKIAAEVLKMPKRGRKLNDALTDVLVRKGAYVVFCSHRFPGQKIQKLQKAILAAIRAARKRLSRNTFIEIYDANRIGDWVNTHPPVALWLATQQRRRTLAGFKSHESWGRDPEIHEVPWVNDDIPRFVPVDINLSEPQQADPLRNLIEEADCKDRNRNEWTFQQAAKATLKFLASGKVAIRIVGPSGFGKTRFAFELFNGRVTASDEIERTALIYADLAIVADEVFKLAHEIADSGSPAILVVDECPDESHTKLSAIARRVGSRLRLVTIDVETKMGRSPDTVVLRLEPAADETIGAIAQSLMPGTDTRLVRELAKGFPKMAVLAAQQQVIGGRAISSARQVLDRIVWGRQQRDNGAQKALELLSLFDWVELTDSDADDGAIIAKKLGGMSQDEFVEGIKSFKSRGIVIQRGHFFQATPIPLAASLAGNRLSVLSANKLGAFFSEAPEQLKRSLLRRLRWLDTYPEARAFARKLLDAKCLGNFTTLNTDFGAECLDYLVHVDPDLAMATIHRVFGKLSNEELQGIESGRRYLVWALAKLAFRKESFDSAATLLRRLAASDAESNIFKSATSQFTQLYQMFLSGTEAPPTARLRVLDDGLGSPNLKEREVSVEALAKMLETSHLSRGGGAEEIGSGEPLKDWAPKTYGDIWNFVRPALKRLTDIAINSDPLCLRAKQILGSHIRGLINALPFDDVRAMISRIVSHYGFWVEAVQEANEWLYFDRSKTAEEVGKAVRAYFNELMPADPVDLAVLYTHGWQADFHDPDVDYNREERSRIDLEYGTRKAIQLAETIMADQATTDRALDRLVTSDAKTVFQFARRLAELAQSPLALFKTALTKAEQKAEAANGQFFRGLVSGVESRDQNTARECVRLALRSRKLKKDAISMIGAGTLQPGDIKLVVSLLRSGDVEPRECAFLSYGRGMDHLSIEHIIPLLEELALHGADGLWATLEIISMILHGGKELPKPLVPVLRNVLVDPALFKNVRSTRDGYQLEMLVKLLSPSNLIDGSFARALVKQLLSICARDRIDIFYELSDSVSAGLRALIDSHPVEVWAEVAELLQENDWRIRRHLETLIGLRYDDHLAAGLLYALPADLYLEWARKDPVHRAPIVLDWLPVATKAEDGSLSWHQALQDFITEFGNQRDVLRALWTRLQLRSWSGSSVPYLESLVKLLSSWSAHTHVEVRQWVRDKLTEIADQIEHEQQRDDERLIRFS